MPTTSSPTSRRRWGEGEVEDENEVEVEGEDEGEDEDEDEDENGDVRAQGALLRGSAKTP
jgi:hypothetical protein